MGGCTAQRAACLGAQKHVLRSLARSQAWARLWRICSRSTRRSLRRPYFPRWALFVTKLRSCKATAFVALPVTCNARRVAQQEEANRCGHCLVCACFWALDVQAQVAAAK